MSASIPIAHPPPPRFRKPEPSERIQHSTYLSPSAAVACKAGTSRITMSFPLSSTKPASENRDSWRESVSRASPSRLASTSRETRAGCSPHPQSAFCAANTWASRAGRTALPLRRQLVREHPQAKQTAPRASARPLRIFRHQREQRIRRKEQGFHIVYGHGGRGERSLLEHCRLADRVSLTDKMKHHLPPVGSEPGRPSRRRAVLCAYRRRVPPHGTGPPRAQTRASAPRSETFPLVRGQRLKQRQAPEHFQPFV